MSIQDLSGSNFQFSAVRPEFLDSNEYTLVTIVLDKSGSVSRFVDLLQKMLDEVVKACKLNPRVDNIMLRLVTFNGNLTEEFGFVPIVDIKTANLPQITCRGRTALSDACYSAIGATLQYSETLLKQDYSVNSILYVITDGEENDSMNSPEDVKKLFMDTSRKEILNKMISILIGIDIASCKASLDDFFNRAGLTSFLDAGDANEKNLAKLGQFISKSISSSSNSLQNGKPVDQQSLTI